MAPWSAVDTTAKLTESSVWPNTRPVFGSRLVERARRAGHGSCRVERPIGAAHHRQLAHFPSAEAESRLGRLRVGHWESVHTRGRRLHRRPVPWQRDICTELREIIWEADPDIEETIKRSVQPYFVLDGNVCALLATKDHINLFLYDPTVLDLDGIINQGEGNKTARAMQIYRDNLINHAALLELLRAIVSNNRAGGWRRIQTAKG